MTIYMYITYRTHPATKITPLTSFEVGVANLLHIRSYNVKTYPKVQGHNFTHEKALNRLTWKNVPLNCCLLSELAM